MLTWIRQDPAFRALWRWAGMLGVYVTLVIGVITWVQIELGVATWAGVTINHLLLAGFLWDALAGFLLFRACRLRFTDLAMAAPVPLRRMWLAHLFAVLISGFAMIAIGIWSSAIGHHLIALLAKRSVPIEPGFGFLAVQLGSVWILAAVLLQRRRPGEAEIPPRDAVYLRDFQLIFFGLLGVVFGLSFLPIWATLAPPALAAWIARRAWLRLPAGYSLPVQAARPASAPRRDDPGRMSVPGGSLSGTGDRIAIARRTFRILNRFYLLYFLGLVFLFLVGISLSEAVTIWLDEGAFRVISLLMGAYILFGMFLKPSSHLFHLDSLPIPRGTVFGVLVVPALLAVFGGYAVGTAAVAWLPPEAEAIELRESHDGTYALFVPPDIMKISRDGEAPPIVAPWGESQEPYRHSVYRDSRTIIWSPYTIPEGSSIEFAAWQISRAVEAVYGETIAAENIREQYLTWDPDGRVVPKDGALTLGADHPEWRIRPRGPAFPVQMSVMIPLYFLLVSIYLRTIRAGVSSRARQWIGYSLLGAVLVLHLLSYPILLHHSRAWIVSGLFDMGIRSLEAAVPGGAITLWVVFLGIFWLSWRLTAAQFDRIEASAISSSEFCWV